MKLSELARCWAARELTRIDCRVARGQRPAGRVDFRAPFAAEGFTVEFPAGEAKGVRFAPAGPAAAPRRPRPLKQVRCRQDLAAGTWLAQGPAAIACFDRPRGTSSLQWG